MKKQQIIVSLFLVSLLTLCQSLSHAMTVSGDNSGIIENSNTNGGALSAVENHAAIQELEDNNPTTGNNSGSDQDKDIYILGQTDGEHIVVVDNPNSEDGDFELHYPGDIIIKVEGEPVNNNGKWKLFFNLPDGKRRHVVYNVDEGHEVYPRLARTWANDPVAHDISDDILNFINGQGELID